MNVATLPAGRSDHRPDDISAEEWDVRVQLAACYRLIDHFGMTDLIYNHITARVPGPEHHFLINPFDPHYSEITASSLVKVDLDRRPADDPAARVNPAGYVIHACIHRARPDLLDGRPIGDTLVPTGAVGMMTVIGEDGAAATTLDDLARGVVILRRLGGALDLTPETFPAVDLRLHEAIEGDRAGDPAIAAEMARAGRALGRLAVQQGYFVRPEAVLVAGPLAAAPSYMAAIREMLDADPSVPMEVIASRVLGAEGGWWASSAIAAWEYLVERPPDLARLGRLAG